MTMQRRYPCHCCDCYTMLEPGGRSDEICPVCYWQDDYVQNRDPAFTGGANEPSLNEAQRNFRALGAIEARFLPYVRPPREDELPPRPTDG